MGLFIILKVKKIFLLKYQLMIKYELSKINKSIFIWLKNPKHLMVYYFKPIFYF